MKFLSVYLSNFQFMFPVSRAERVLNNGGSYIFIASLNCNQQKRNCLKLHTSISFSFEFFCRSCATSFIRFILTNGFRHNIRRNSSYLSIYPWLKAQRMKRTVSVFVHLCFLKHLCFFNIADSSMGCNINAQKNFENEYVSAVNT